MPAERKLLRSLIWRRLDSTVLEYCRLWKEEQGFHFEGTVLLGVNNTPVQSRYEVVCTNAWETRFARVHMDNGSKARVIELECDQERRWRCNGKELFEMRGNYDVDLAISPCTNTLPIRRLSLNVGQSENVTAVWVRFPDPSIVPLPQRYTRIAERRYRYESRGGQFTAELEVDDAGLVKTYGTYWERVADFQSSD